MNSAIINPDGVSSSNVALVESNVVSSGLSIVIPCLVESNFQISINEHSQPSNNGYSVGERDDLVTWHAGNGKRFDELSLKESFENLSPDELAELNQLTRMRRAAKYPRTADAILWERKQRKITSRLIQALTEYVEFYEPTRGA